MKFPKKLWPWGAAFGTCALLASASAFAALPAASGGPALPKGAEGIPQYMIGAGDLANSSYISCIKSKLAKGSPTENVVSDHQAALECQSLKD